MRVGVALLLCVALMAEWVFLSGFLAGLHSETIEPAAENITEIPGDEYDRCMENATGPLGDEACGAALSMSNAAAHLSIAGAKAGHGLYGLPPWMKFVLRWSCIIVMYTQALAVLLIMRVPARKSV